MLKDSSDNMNNHQVISPNITPEANPELKEILKDDPTPPSSERNKNKTPVPMGKMTNGDTDVSIKTEDNKNNIKSNDKGVKDEPGGNAAGNEYPRKMTPGAQQAGPTNDQPFMQQHSQIFVFPTDFANMAAEMVLQRKCKSIIEYHMGHPKTKEFLQRNPMKPNMNRPSGPGGMQQFGGPGMGNIRNMNPHMMKNPDMPPGMMPGNNNSVAQWVQQQNAHLEEQGIMNNNPLQPNVPPFPQNNPRMMNWNQQMNQQGNVPQMPMNPNFDFDQDFQLGGMNNPNNMNLLQSKVPNENLTPEQLQKRGASLAKLRKFQEMLFPEQRDDAFMDGPGGPMGPMGPGGPGGPGPGPNPNQGMMPDGMFQPNMMSQQHGMMGQGMMSQQGMMGNQHGMMSQQQQQFMMSQQQNMSQFGPQPPQGMQNMPNMTPPQREWQRLQQEFYSSKIKHQRISMDPNCGGNGPPPPPYYNPMGQKGMGGPTSPNMNGPHMPGSGPVMDGEMGNFPPGPMRRPMDPMQGAMSPNFNGNMPPHGPGFDQHMMPNMPGRNVSTMLPPSRRSKNSNVSLFRAGNPEQFCPDPPPRNVNGMGNKPPPTYAQAQKRKRDDMEDIYKNLQPTPSPQQLNYLNQFEGQELTITKQANTAFHDQGMPGDPHFLQNQVNSPMHGPAGMNNNKGPMSNSSQNSSAGPLGSPGPLPGQPNMMSGANMRLSHFDPPSSNNISSAPSTPTANSSMSHITSNSLANLAKGVEHLSNKMQQNMMQGGPYHSIQVQGQMNNSSNSSSSSNSSNTNNTITNSNNNNINSSNNNNNNSVTSSSQVGLPTTSSSVSSVSQTQSTPSVNNTYVNATMSIQQLNIQSVNAPNGPGSGSGYNPTMQVQQMNNGMSQMPPGGPNGPHNGPHNVPSSIQNQASMSQSSSMLSGMGPLPHDLPPHGNPGSLPGHMQGPGAPIPHGPGGMMPGGPSPIPSNIPVSMSHPGSAGPFSGSGPLPGPAMTIAASMSQSQSIMVNNGMGPGSRPMGKSPGFSSPPQSAMGGGPNNNPMMQPGNRMSSPNYPPNSVGNANVQIQAKAPNTIQYLPAHPPNNQPNGGGSQKRPELEFMQQFMDGKSPTSNLNYFPPNQNPPMRPQGVGSPFSNQQIAMQQSMMMRTSSTPEFPMGGPGGMQSGPMPGMDMPNSMNPMNNGPGMSTMPESIMAGMGMSMGNMPNMGGAMSPMGGVMGNGRQVNPAMMNNGQGMMNSSMMQSQHMQMQSQRSMGNMPMQSPPGMRQPNPGMRMPGMMPGNPGYGPQQMYPQHMYNQGRQRQMAPMGMMGNPNQPYMGMMSNMPGPT